MVMEIWSKEDRGEREGSRGSKKEWAERVKGVERKDWEISEASNKPANSQTKEFVSLSKKGSSNKGKVGTKRPSEMTKKSESW
jgi:hypothetical protein